MAKSPRTPFVHKLNFDRSYDSVCTNCCVTVAKAEIETDLRKLEDAHICSPFALGGLLHPEDEKRPGSDAADKPLN